MNVVSRWVGLVSFGLCTACYGATDGGNDPDPDGGGRSDGRSGSGGATTGGSVSSGGATTGGSVSSGGSFGFSGSPGTGGAIGRGGSGGSPSGGYAGTDPGTEDCNDLQPVYVELTCSSATPSAATGGVIPDGVYALVEYQSGSCDVDIDETLRITRTLDGSYDLELVVSVVDARANGVLTTSGTTLTSVLTCGGDGAPATNQYSVYQELGVDYLDLSSASGTFTFQRVGQ